MATYLTTGLFIPNNTISQIGGIAAPTPLFEIMAGPADRPVINEIGISIMSGAASVFALGFGFPPAGGQAPYMFGVISRIGITEDIPPTRAQVTVASAWRIAPSAPTRYLRRVCLLPSSNIITIPSIWRFPRGISLAPSSSLAAYIVQSVAFHTFYGEYSVEWDN